MKKMLLKSMQIDFFKAIEHLEISFDPAKTEIEGANETGKTTIFDALCYCLTGKNSKGESTFGIKPNFAHEAVSPAVSIECTINEKPVNLKRVYQAKFAKDKTFKRYQTECYINDLPKTVAEFEGYICENVADTDLFKLLTNPKYFVEQMNSKRGETASMRQRAMLYSMAEEVTDADIIASEERFAPLAEALERYDSVSEYKQYVKSAISKTKKQVEDFPIRITQQAKNFKTVEQSEEEVLRQLSEIVVEREKLMNSEKVSEKEKELYKTEKAAQRLSQRCADLINENEKYKTEQHRTHMENVKASSKELNDQLAEMREKQAAANFAYYEKSSELKQKLMAARTEAEAHKRNVESLRKDYGRRSKQSTTVATECPTCHRPFPVEEVEEQNRRLAEAKEQELKEIEAKGNSEKELLHKFSEEVESIQKEIAELQKPDFSMKIVEMEKELNKKLNATFEVSDMPDFESRRNEMKVEIYHVHMQEETLNKEIVEIKNANRAKIQELSDKEDSFQDILTSLEINKRCQALIDDLEEQRHAASEKLDSLHGMADLADEFIHHKCELMTEKINSLFKVTRWKLFNFTQEGDIVEICVPVYNGTEYKDLSASTKTMCGLDIVKGFQRHYDIFPPIFIDEKETITESVNLPCQCVTLCAVEENCPKCGCETGRKQDNGLWKCKKCGHEFKKVLKISKGE